jgi:trehalose/maltose transport system substrate-binding protein
MSRLLVIFLFLGFISTTFASSKLDAATITISCGAIGIELELCRQGAEAWSSESGHSVKVISTPNSSTERLALYQQLLAAKADDIDVLQIDVIWPGLLASHLLDLGPQLSSQTGQHFPQIIQNNTIDGRLVAMPWFASVAVLYYRSDLLDKYGEPVPRTWEDLKQTALRIQLAERDAGANDMWGYVWQGRAYEGLTCNGLEWIAGEGGGTIVDDDGSITVDNPDAARALARAANWIEMISPPGVLNYAEEEARGVFQSGNAVFMRNWPYAWRLAQSPDSPVRDKVGVAPLPAGSQKSVSTLGGWQLAVSRYSRHPEAATDLVRYLTSRQEQKRRAIAGAFNPTTPALYRDAEILAAAPFFGELLSIIRSGVARPSASTASKYNQVSNAFWNALHSTLSGEQDAAASLHALAGRLRRMSRGGRRW